jgi:hypothetical protein
VVPSDTGWFFTTLAENALARDDWEFTLGNLIKLHDPAGKKESIVVPSSGEL